jgi:type I restriction-modification system DNA methylase subunit
METGTKVPYLNGGLFEPEYDVDAVNRKLHFKGGLFEELLDFFNQYNFTIDENDDSDAEVGVDPEMLGRIFEQLIEDNEKDMQGTIYTPFEVVRFMCRHSLLLHLSQSSASNRTVRTARRSRLSSSTETSLR